MTSTSLSPDDRIAAITVACIAEPADPWIGRMVAEHGAGETIDRIRHGGSRIPHRQGLRARLETLDINAHINEAERKGVRIVTRGDAEWPTQLDDLGQRVPHALWVDGSADLRLVAASSVAIVGARACTRYGAEVAADLAGELTSGNIHVFSGGAFGVDAAAHRGALGVGGITVCVLASGVDVAYPRAHDELLIRISETGAVVSESPLGAGVRRQRFLSRNRIIAALTRATVVVEAARRSGSLSTAHEAEALNRVVAAVPGPVTSEMSRGTHQLLRDNRATLVTSASDVRELVTMEVTLGTPSDGDSWFVGLHHLERAVLDSMPMRISVDVEYVVLATALSYQQVASALGALEALGKVSHDAMGWRVSVAPPARAVR